MVLWRWVWGVGGVTLIEEQRRQVILSLYYFVDQKSRIYWSPWSNPGLRGKDLTTTKLTPNIGTEYFFFRLKEVIPLCIIEFV